MKSPSLLFHQCTIQDKWRISGNLLVLDDGCLINSFPATSGSVGRQDYRHQSDEGGIIPCNKETSFSCYRVSTVPWRSPHIKGLMYKIRPNLVSIFGQQREIDFIHLDFFTLSYPNGIVLITENPLKSEFIRVMQSINDFGNKSIPLVVSYSRYGSVSI